VGALLELELEVLKMVDPMTELTTGCRLPYRITQC